MALNPQGLFFRVLFVHGFIFPRLGIPSAFVFRGQCSQITIFPMPPIPGLNIPKICVPKALHPLNMWFKSSMLMLYISRVHLCAPGSIVLRLVLPRVYLLKANIFSKPLVPGLYISNACVPMGLCLPMHLFFHASAFLVAHDSSGRYQSNTDVYNNPY